MSIKHFTNQPCEVCKKDTTHYANKCRDCGNAKPYIKDLIAASRKRFYAKHGKYYGAMAKLRVQTETTKRFYPHASKGDFVDNHKPSRGLKSSHTSSKLT